MDSMPNGGQTGPVMSYRGDSQVYVDPVAEPNAWSTL